MTELSPDTMRRGADVGSTINALKKCVLQRGSQHLVPCTISPPGWPYCSHHALLSYPFLLSDAAAYPDPLDHGLIQPLPWCPQL